MQDIACIMEMLNWNNDIQTQTEGLALAKNFTDLNVFMQPMEYGNKEVWENCAKVIAVKSDKIIKPYLMSLLEWLQDLNWPGAFIILNRMKGFTDEILASVLSQCIDAAIDNQDETWLCNLYYLLENKNLEAVLEEKYVTILLHYHNHQL
jgi:hypothetical protein